MAEIGGFQTKDFFFEINTIFCTFCVVTDIVCCCVPPNSASFFKCAAD